MQGVCSKLPSTKRADWSTHFECWVTSKWIPQQRRGTWRNTMAGNALANATAAPTISRRDACRRVEEFLARARSVNSDDSWLHRIGKVVVFGSYLNNQDRIGHIDLAIRLERRAKVDEDWVEAVLNVAEAAERRGHRFRGFVDRLAEKLGRILACLSCK